MKKTNLSAKSLAFAGLCLMLSPYASAQAPAAAVSDPSIYLVREYMKIEPGKGEDYLKTETVWKRVHQRRVAEGKILSWNLSRCVFPSGTNAKYDYMTVTAFKSGKEMEEALGMTMDYITKGMTKEDLAVAENTEKTRKLVSSELDMQIQRVQPQEQGRFFKIMQVKTVADKGDELENIENQMKPVFEEAAKMGNITGWRFGQHLQPSHIDESNYYRVINTKTLDALLKTESNDYLRAAFRKVYPTKSFDDTVKNLKEIMSTVKTEMWERVDATN